MTDSVFFCKMQHANIECPDPISKHVCTNLNSKIKDSILFLIERPFLIRKEPKVLGLHEICRTFPRVKQYTAIKLFTRGNILQISCNPKIFGSFLKFQLLSNKKWPLVMNMQKQIKCFGINLLNNQYKNNPEQRNATE